MPTTRDRNEAVKEAPTGKSKSDGTTAQDSVQSSTGRPQSGKPGKSSTGGQNTPGAAGKKSTADRAHRTEGERIREEAGFPPFDPRDNPYYRVHAQQADEQPFGDSKAYEASEKAYKALEEVYQLARDSSDPETFAWARAALRSHGTIRGVQ